MRSSLLIRLLPAILASLSSAAAAAEIRVPQDAPSIGAAVLSAGAGDVIVVAKGSYAEDVLVQGRSDLTIQGTGKVVLKPVTTGIAIRGCARVTVRGIGVAGGTDGIEIRDSQDVTLESFAVANVRHDGVTVFASNNVRIRTGRVAKCPNDGVSLGGNDPGEGVTGGEITGVKASAIGEDGVEVVGSDIVVSNCKVKGVGDDGFEAASEGAGPVRFERCKAKACGSDGFDLSSPDSTAIDCSSTKADDDGFDIEGSGSRVERCVAKGGRQRGFEVENVTGVVVVACTSSGNREEGFEVVNSTGSRIESCVAKKSGSAGFALDATSTGNTLTGNKASKSRTVDLRDESPGGSNTFANNTFKTTEP